MSMSRTITLTATRPPASLQIRAPALSTANARLPPPPSSCRLLDGGKTDRMDGHIGSAQKNGVNANEDGGAATHGKGDCQSVSTHSLATDSGTPAPGPLCDLRRSCSDADMELKKTLRVCHSSRIAASCCQPSLTIPGSCSSGSLVCGRRPSCTPVPVTTNWASSDCLRVLQ